MKEKLRKKIIVIMNISFTLLIILAIIASSIVILTVNGEPRKRIYLSKQQTLLMHFYPEKYKRKYVKLSGYIKSIKCYKDYKEIMMITNVENYKNDVIIYSKDKMIFLNSNNYISIDGYIHGTRTNKPYIISSNIGKTI